MRICDVCATDFSEAEISCPRCRVTLGGFLSRPLTEYPNQRKVALETIQALENRWAFNPFAPGWRLVDVMGRIVLILVLVGLAFSVNRSVRDQSKQALLQLETHKLEASKAERSSNAGVQQVGVQYSNLVISADELIRALEWNGRLHVAVLLGLMALLATSAISSYREFKELNKVKATLRYLCTNEGRAFVGEGLVWLASKKLEDLPEPEEPKAEEPKAEEPKAEEPKAEEPKAEEPKAEAEPEPRSEEPTDDGEDAETSAAG